MPDFLIGIDLGTTNSALAYVDLRRRGRDGRPQVKTFAVQQLIDAGQVAGRELLPSFLYLGGGHDLPPGALTLPWDKDRAYAVGEFARNHGARVPGRLVTSAKSWLCHAGVDRSAALLPWSAPPDVPRISPVEASARYLCHFVESWNATMTEGREENRLESLPVVLTVPASFDEVARTLTVEAARKAGLKHLTLLEEPQAAFYCWIATAPEQEAHCLHPGDLCVVVDVGGGTTDFSLIQAVEERGDFGFVRQAVGEHLLLGGDNMDLALAKWVEGKLPGAGRLDATGYAALTQACRHAKETLLSPKPPAQHTITVMGRGRSVVGGTLHTQVSPEDVRNLLFDGFFPAVPREAEPIRAARVGLHEMGLPYVGDPAITRHLAAFLRKHMPANTAPQAILFNGGVFQPESLRQRIVDVARTWFEVPDKPWNPALLTTPSLDLAVAWGAASYAWIRHSGGRRIGGGTSRAYYIGVAQAEGAAPDQNTVVCVVPRHLEEGNEVVLEKPELELAIGQPVVFPLFSSTVRGEDRPGDVLRLAPDQLARVPPLHTILRGGKRSGAKNVPVHLAARSTEIGTLELFCVAREGGNRWRLEFNTRDVLPEETASEPPPIVSDVWDEGQVQAAALLLRTTYASGDGPTPSPQELTRHLETALGASRSEWPTGLCRRLWEFLAEISEQRRRSPGHAGRWYNLAGFCLRPGFGERLDRFRVEQLWKILNAPPRSAATYAQRLPESGVDYWIMWRRVSGGLHGPLQQALYDRLRPLILPGKGKSVALKPQPNELSEMWRTVASLERLDLKPKEALGEALLNTIKRGPLPQHVLWSLTRLGARVLLYGPLNTVVHPEVVQRWLETLLPFEPTSEKERLAWAFCLAQLARRTGQRALDIDDSHREQVLTALRASGTDEALIAMVETTIASAGDERSQMFGDALPIGLRLSGPQD